MFGRKLIAVLPVLAPMIRDLVRAILANDDEERKRAIVRLDVAAEREAVRRARKG